MPSLSHVVMAQSTDSLALRRSLLADENNRYIQIAQHDGILTTNQADSLRKISSGSIEKPINLGIDLLMQVRDYIDSEYEKKMSMDIANEYANNQYLYSAKSMLPKVLSIPDDYVSPEEREQQKMDLAMEQLAVSLANDFEREKMPAWQVWWRKYLRIFFGDRGYLKGKSTFFNGQYIPVPADNSPRR